MIKINYPEKKPRIRAENGREYIFCEARKRWLLITPEEWVRQNFLLYLVEVLGFPWKLIAVEKQLIIGEMKKRFDIIVYRHAKPFMIVECKEMNVKLTETTLQQVLRYNSQAQAEYIVVTNGISCAAFRRLENSFAAISELPMAEAGGAEERE